jgi:hypothetical protein
MKKTVLLLAFTICCLSSGLAQLKRGSVMTTASFAYNRNNTQSFFFDVLAAGLVDQTNFYTSVGSLFTKRFAMGLDLNVDYRFNEIENFDIQFGATRFVEYNTVTMAGLFARWNFPLSARVVVFVEPGYGLGFGTNKRVLYSASSPSTTIESKSKTHTFRIKTGINYFVTERFAFEVTPGVISWNHRIPESGEPSSGFNANVGLRNLTFGVVCFFGGVED